MSLLTKFLFIGSIVFVYKALSLEDKMLVKETIKKKILKYKPKILEIIDLLDLYTKEPSGIREENVNYKEKLDNLSSSIQSLNDEEILKDIDYIVNVAFKKNQTKNITNTKISKPDLAVKNKSTKIKKM